MELPANKETNVISQSMGGEDIQLSRIGTGKLPVLLIGGVHGNESEGFLLAERFWQALFDAELILDPDVSLYICPRLNPDGCKVLRRTNQNNVDLNRNLPTKDWESTFKIVKYFPGSTAGSEPESKLCIDMIQAIQPACIISLHSYEHAMINFNGPCEDLAQAMSVHNKLPPKGDIGYPTPGSLGTWAGWERNIPTLTLEVKRDQQPNAVWEQHKQGLLTASEFYLKHDRPESQYN